MRKGIIWKGRRVGANESRLTLFMRLGQRDSGLMPISSRPGSRKLRQYMVICAQLVVPFVARELLEHRPVTRSFPVTRATLPFSSINRVESGAVTLDFSKLYRTVSIRLNISQFYE